MQKLCGNYEDWIMSVWDGELKMDRLQPLIDVSNEAIAR